MIAIFSDQANRERRRSCGSDTLTDEYSRLINGGAGCSVSTLVERNGILPEVSCPRVSRTPTERSAKLDYGDEVEINRPKILRGTLRIFDIAPVAASTNYYPIAEPARRQTWLSEERDHDVFRFPITSC